MHRLLHIENDVFIDPSSGIMGDVILRRSSSVWPLSVFRGYHNRIVAKKEAAIIERVMIKAPARHAVEVGKKSLITHEMRLHEYAMHRGVLVGFG